MNKNIEITKTFKTRSGSEVTVSGTLILEKEVWLDGHTDTVTACEIYVDVKVEGKGSQGGDVRSMNENEKKQAPAGYNWVCGRLGLTDEQAEIIKSVREELEAHPAWQAKQALIAANQKAQEKIDAQRRSSPGWCRRCQDWTWCDCGH